MTPVHLVAASVGFLLLGFVVQRRVMGAGGGKLRGWLPILITAPCLAVTASLMLRCKTGEETMTFLIWLCASAILLFLLIGMGVGHLVGRILDKAKR